MNPPTALSPWLTNHAFVGEYVTHTAQYSAACQQLPSAVSRGNLSEVSPVPTAAAAS